jgi:hypothetical protein
VYRQWIRWNYARRTEIWDLNNRVTQEAGGPDCLWIGMNSGSVTGQSQSFRDVQAICSRAEMILLDHQARSDSTGFQQNGESGKLIHDLLGWNKLVPESMALYQAGRPTFRKSAKPEPEARLWILEGFAGTIQPWWHHVGGHQEDRRQFNTIEPLNRWHEAHQEFLVDRQPVDNVGVVWSQQNTDFYGRDHAEELVELPLRGVTEALLRARIPYLMVHADQIERDSADLDLLILPNLAAISDSQIASVRRFAAAGGGLVLTGDTGLYDESGDPRPDFALADLTGAHWPAGQHVPSEATLAKRASETLHSYLRLPGSPSDRHPILRGFEETDILAFGGSLPELKVDPGAIVPLTLVPPFPIYPPETSWMREPRTQIPAVILNSVAKGSRVAHLVADIDRRFARDSLPDHAALLRNVFRWASRNDPPLAVHGPGMIDCHLYRQPSRLVLHLVNLTNAGTWRQPVDELIPVGPLQIRVRLLPGQKPSRVRCLVSGLQPKAGWRDGWVTFELKSILDHEVVVVG